MWMQVLVGSVLFFKPIRTALIITKVINKVMLRSLCMANQYGQTYSLLLCLNAGPQHVSQVRQVQCQIQPYRSKSTEGNLH